MNITHFLQEPIQFRDKISLFNALIQLNSYTSYLEIGFFEGKTFNNIMCHNKVGVDPNPLVYNPHVRVQTSDEFFIQNTNTFDLIHIDGLHEAEQISKDIENSLRILNEGGFIILHDCLPWEEYLQEPKPREGAWWTGDGWKAFAKLRQTRPDLTMFTIPIDCGLGVIQVGKQDLYPDNKKNLDYSYFLQNKKNLMRIKYPTHMDLVKDKEGFYRHVIKEDLSMDINDRCWLLRKLGLSDRKDLLEI